MYRTTSCNSLRKEHIGQSVTVAGGIHSRCDCEGLAQVVFRPEEFAQVSGLSRALRAGDVISITGKMSSRLPVIARVWPV